MKLQLTVLALLGLISLPSFTSAQTINFPTTLEGVWTSDDGRSRNDMSLTELKFDTGKMTGKVTYRWREPRYNQVNPCSRSNDEMEGTYTLDEKGALQKLIIRFPEKSQVCGVMTFRPEFDTASGNFKAKTPSGQLTLAPGKP